MRILKRRERRAPEKRLQFFGKRSRWPSTRIGAHRAPLQCGSTTRLRLPVQRADQDVQPVDGLIHIVLSGRVGGLHVQLLNAVAIGRTVFMHSGGQKGTIYFQISSVAAEVTRLKLKITHQKQVEPPYVGCYSSIYFAFSTASRG